MSYSQKRNEMCLKYLSEQIKFERDLSNSFDNDISSVETEILEIQKENIFIRLKNNTLRHEEPILGDVNSDSLKEMGKITKYMNNQQKSKEKYVNNLAQQMKTVRVVYTNFSEIIKKSSDVIKDNQHYRNIISESIRNIELKKIELTHQNESLEISRTYWTNEIEGKSSLHDVLCEIDREIEEKLKKEDSLPKNLTQIQRIIKSNPSAEKKSEIFKKPWTPKKMLKKC